MKLLVFGQTGQVARELQRRAPGASYLGRAAADLTDPAACAAALRAARPDAVINAAAWTAVDRAETEEAEATVVNGDAPGAMALAAADLGIPLVHISTDYVFDGAGTTPWQPNDPVAPLGAYGRSKLAGEVAVRAAGGTHVILRTSWVFSAHGANFVKTMLRLGADRPALRVVADQIGGPTPAGDIAATCLTLAAALRDGAEGGTHHYGGAPATSWAGFAREIFALAGLAVTVEDIPTEAFPTPARRPANSRLDGSTLQAAFGIAPPDWKAGLAEVIAELKGAGA
ncbi:MAG: dTDP-4-dehydrorhamnose reductase [Rhodobacteraceae bacterium]|nr:dTDP-4-dehydrorhamnose reductase [Paracoccaceae bacterium]